jgi:hypothetical protein
MPNLCLHALKVVEWLARDATAAQKMHQNRVPRTLDSQAAARFARGYASR